MTHVLGDGDEVSLTESGKEAYRSRDLPAAYEEIAGLLSPETLHAAIFLASRGHTVGEIARRLPIEEPSAGWLHVQWLMKQGLLGVRVQGPISRLPRKRREGGRKPPGLRQEPLSEKNNLLLIYQRPPRGFDGWLSSLRGWGT